MMSYLLIVVDDNVVVWSIFNLHVSLPVYSIYVNRFRGEDFFVSEHVSVA